MGYFKRLENELNEIINGAAEYEDGETGTDRCIESYCKDNKISDEKMEAAQRLAFRQGAIEAGIPLDVIDGKRKLNAKDKIKNGLSTLIDIQIEGIDSRDYPDLCDSYIESACWPDGKELTEDELNEINENHSDFVHELASLEVVGG